MDPVTQDIREQLHRQRAEEEGRPRLSRGFFRPGGPPRKSVFWWWLHLSRIGIRILLQEAKRGGKELNDPKSWDHVNTQWPRFMRNCAVAIAMKRARDREPEELAKLGEIPEGNAADRAVFLSRWFPVPKPDCAGPATWSREDLPELARWMVHQVEENSNAWSWHPDGWRESLQLLREGVER